MNDKIYLQHEVRGGYPGCSKCHKKNYPYYLGSDKKYYCEDCSVELVNKLKVAQFGRLPKQNYCSQCGGTGRSNRAALTRTAEAARIDEEK